MLYIIMLRKKDKFGCYTFFEFDRTTQYEVMRHWCKFFDERYECVGKRREDKRTFIYYDKGYTVY